MPRLEEGETMDDRDHHELINRREAILRVSAMLGGAALVGQAAMLAGCGMRDTAAPAGESVEAGDAAFLDEVAETILPETGTPGAKAAGVGAFIALMVADTYSPDEQAVFRAGIETLETRCGERFGTGFLAAAPDERLGLLQEFDVQQLDYMNGWQAGEPVHFFRMLKELTLLGYFTSEIGYTRAMRYEETPGRFDPCTPYTPGETIHANHA